MCYCHVVDGERVRGGAQVVTHVSGRVVKVQLRM